MDSFTLEQFNSYLKERKKIIEPALEQIRQFEEVIAPQVEIMNAATENVKLATEHYDKIRSLIPDVKKFYSGITIPAELKNDVPIEIQLTNLDSRLVKLKEKQDFTKQEKESLLLASEFIANQNIQESNEIRDYLKSMPTSLFEDNQEISDESELVSNETQDSEHEEKVINQDVDPSFLDVFLNKQTFYGSLSDFIYQAIFAMAYGVINGVTSPMTLMLVVSILCKILIKPNK
ncbi:hypothetical protein [Enterococcus mundtii]|uniref:Uncharacterized protein n=1 Tax=Enterococcus mundtii TaxID=53346 RepID=A0A2S7RUD8_ENTMU|nr:hypothetical protein [Enterococcus mundtii]PQF23394.1 hypothetical protein CUS89_07445 [Enterococcus mundtii]